MSSARKDPRAQVVPMLDTHVSSINLRAAMTARQIAETDHVVAIYQPGEGDVLYVTFNSVNERHKGLNFSGDRLLRRLGRPAIGIMATAANWYPKAAMASIVAAARAVIVEGGFRQVVCFGHGMGGYGALRFAAELQADVAIAFSPITTIDPGQTSVPNKFWPRMNPDLRSGMLPEQRHVARRTYVIYDQHSHHDRWHANRLAAFPATELVLFPIAGHETLAAFGNGDDVLHVIDSLVAGDTKRARRGIRAARGNSATYHERLSEALAGRGFAEAAAKAARRAAELQPESHRILANYARKLRAVGRQREAVEQLLAAAPLLSRRAGEQRKLFQELLRAKEVEIARDLMARARDVPELLLLTPVSIAAVLVASGAKNEAKGLLESITPQVTDDAADLDFLAGALVGSGEAAAAIAFLKCRKSQTPTDLGVRIRLAQARKQAGFRVKAKLEAEEADGLDLQSTGDIRALMRLHGDLGARHRLVALAERILKVRPELFEVRQELIESHIKSRDLVSVRNHLETALRYAMDDAGQLAAVSHHYTRIARVYESLSKTKKGTPKPPVDDRVSALAAAERAVALNPTSVGNRIILAAAEVGLGLLKPARRTLDFTIRTLEPTDSSQWLRLAELLRDTKQKERSLAVARRAPRAAGWTDASRVAFGRLLVELGELDEAKEILKPVDPATLDVNQLRFLAEDLVKVSETVLARAATEQYLKLDPGDPAMTIQLGWLRLLPKTPEPPPTIPPATPRPRGFLGRLFGGSGSPDRVP
jgi:tetratricopeptide (TPR) repeat protein